MVAVILWLLRCTEPHCAKDKVPLLTCHEGTEGGAQEYLYTFLTSVI